jgi:hypothetical protein
MTSSGILLQFAWEELRLAGDISPDLWTLRVGAVECRKLLLGVCMVEGWLGDCFRKATMQGFRQTMIPQSGKGTNFLAMVGLFAKTGVVKYEREAEELVGFLFVEQSIALPSCFYLSTLVVSRTWQQKKAGTALLRVTEAWLRRKETVSCIQLNVNNEDRPTDEAERAAASVYRKPAEGEGGRPWWLYRFYVGKMGYRERRVGEPLCFGADPAIEFPLLKSF